ncbi:hypothetical protein ACFL0T_07900 [Candidatus Omnitrophota bacterium]
MRKILTLLLLLTYIVCLSLDRPTKFYALRPVASSNMSGLSLWDLKGQGSFYRAIIAIEQYFRLEDTPLSKPKFRQVWRKPKKGEYYSDEAINLTLRTLINLGLLEKSRGQRRAAIFSLSKTYKELPSPAKQSVRLMLKKLRTHHTVPEIEWFKNELDIRIQAAHERERLIEIASPEITVSDGKYLHITVSPTDHCPVMCDFCSFSARPCIGRPESDKVFSDKGIDRFIKFVDYSEAVSLCIAGGGEPITEMPKILRIIAETKVKTISLVTSAYIATTPKRTRDFLSSIEAALKSRTDKGLEDVQFGLAVSVPEKDRRKVPLDNLIRIVNELRQKTKFPHINMLFVKCAGGLWKKDLHYEVLAKLEGKIVDSNGFFSGNIELDDGFKILYEGSFMNYNLGRAKRMVPNDGVNFSLLQKLERNAVLGNMSMGIAHESDLPKGIDMFSPFQGINFSLDINADGSIGPNVYLARTFPVGNIYEDDLSAFDKRLRSDPVLLVLRDHKKGAARIIKTACKIDPRLKAKVNEAGEIGSAIATCLEDPLMQLALTKWFIIEMHLEEKQVSEGTLYKLKLARRVDGECAPYKFETIRREYRRSARLIRKRKSRYQALDQSPELKVQTNGARVLLGLLKHGARRAQDVLRPAISKLAPSSLLARRKVKDSIARSA